MQDESHGQDFHTSLSSRDWHPPLLHPSQRALLGQPEPSSSNLSCSNLSGADELLTISGPSPLSSATMESSTSTSSSHRYDIPTDEPVETHSAVVSHEQEIVAKRPMQCKMCEICFTEQNTIQPCARCDCFYCIECIQEMFHRGLRKMISMPARCCTVIQLPIVKPYISKEQADSYRDRLEEWRSSSRIYCPKPTCSAFIPERFLMPQSNTPPTLWKVVKPRLASILQSLLESTSARFFWSAASPDRHSAIDYHTMVRTPVCLDEIINKLPCYESFEHFMTDLDQFFINSRFLNTGRRDIGPAGDPLRDLFNSKLSDLVIELSPTKANMLHQNACFACPKCFIAICLKCKQIAHPLKPCDFTFLDYESALLTKFGYKQCPKCSHAVKRMYGCRLMECHCGALWCYHCARPIEVCDEDDCGGSDEPDNDAQDSSDMIEQVNTSNDADNADKNIADGKREWEDKAGERADRDESPMDLDTGGARRWRNQGDFGAEPDETDISHMYWSCRHDFRIHTIKATKVENGYPLQLECNRCYTVVHACKVDDDKVNKMYYWEHGKLVNNAQWLRRDETKPMALECSFCAFVACKDCKAYYEAKYPKGEAEEAEEDDDDYDDDDDDDEEEDEDEEM